MGRKRTPGVYPAEDGTGWQVNAQYKGKPIRRRGFLTAEEAEAYLISQKECIRKVRVLGEAQKYTFEQAAIHYVMREQERGKDSLETEIHLLKRITRVIGDIPLDRICQATVQPLIAECRREGLKNKTINNSLAIVIRICNLAAREWRDENGNPWLAVPPLIRKLDLSDQRPPRPISWAEQKKLLPELPLHLANMALFGLNTGVRDNVIVSLQWDWEIKVPLGDDLSVSAFLVPKEHVKGKRQSRVLVCNSVAQSIVDQQRGKHETHVFVYRRERVKNRHIDPVMEYRPVDTMNNTAWQNARKKAGLGDLHVHDLRHTVGMRLREAGIREQTISDILWHGTKTMTAHYSTAQIHEIYSALELIKSETNRTNVSLLSLVRLDGIYQNPTWQKKTG